MIVMGPSTAMAANRSGYRSPKRSACRPPSQSPTEVTGGFCTSGSEREFTLEGSWYADEEI